MGSVLDFTSGYQRVSAWAVPYLFGKEIHGIPALSPGGVERKRQLELELFGLGPAGHHFSSLFQADMDILMCQQPFPCHQLAGTSHLAPAKAAQSNPVWLHHSCLTLAPMGSPVCWGVWVQEPKLLLLLAEVCFVIFPAKGTWEAVGAAVC